MAHETSGPKLVAVEAFLNSAETPGPPASAPPVPVTLKDEMDTGDLIRRDPGRRNSHGGYQSPDSAEESDARYEEFRNRNVESARRWRDRQHLISEMRAETITHQRNRTVELRRENELLRTRLEDLEQRVEWLQHMCMLRANK